jgi:hypothetical protein
MMIKPIPHADEADIAEQARPVDDGIDECDAVPDELGENRDADAGDLVDQKLSVSGQDDDHPPAAGHAVAALATGRVFWPAWESDSLTTQRSFVDDMASAERAIPTRLVIVDDAGDSAGSSAGRVLQLRQLGCIRRPWALHDPRPNP